MRLALALFALAIAACGTPVTASACSTGGKCPCFAGAECRDGLTCAFDADWRVFDCTCSSTKLFTCTAHAKPSGPCEPGAYCNKGMTSCLAETVDCNRDCRCEYTKTPGQGVWLCQDNCAAAKACPKAQPTGACTLAPAVQCRYWSTADSEVTCTCSAAGMWSCA